MKSDTFHMSMLFDFYGELLTDNQKWLFNLYYNEDMSLMEISEIAGINRLGLVKRYANIQRQAEIIARAASAIVSVNAAGPRSREIANQAELILQTANKLSE